MTITDQYLLRSPSVHNGVDISEMFKSASLIKTQETWETDGVKYLRVLTLAFWQIDVTGLDTFLPNVSHINISFKILKDEVRAADLMLYKKSDWEFS